MLNPKIIVSHKGLLTWQGAYNGPEDYSDYYEMSAFNKLIIGGEKTRKAFINRFCQGIYIEDNDLLGCWHRALHRVAGRRIMGQHYKEFVKVAGVDPLGFTTIDQLTCAYRKYKSSLK